MAGRARPPPERGWSNASPDPKDPAVDAVDGSGLTRSNRASPADVVGLLRSLSGTTAGEALIQDMALAGHEGTVEDRMHGTAAYGRCRTKTGTLTGVSNLSGYCFDAAAASRSSRS